MTKCECFGGHTYGKPCTHDCHPFRVGAETTVVKPTTNETPDVWATLRGEA